MESTTTTTSSPRTFTLASRASQLAQIQTQIALKALQSLHPSTLFGTHFMSTSGDANQSAALYLLGGKSLWTGELEAALALREVDMLVHSFKDVPTVLPEGCVIGAILEREDPVDCLVVKQGEPWVTLEDLPEGSVVGTSSVRRVAQLRRKFPTLQFMDVRGNLNTRLAKLDNPKGPYVALILAKSGLVRLGLGSRVTSSISPPTLYHAVSQGALAIEIRSDDAEAQALCDSITHWQTQWQCVAERACLRVLEGGCSVPVGIASELILHGRNVADADDSLQKPSATLTLTGCVTGISGEQHVEYTLSEKVGNVAEAELVGVSLAKTLLKTGAKEILDAINIDREKRVGEAKTQDEVQRIETMMEGSLAHP